MPISPAPPKGRKTRSELILVFLFIDPCASPRAARRKTYVCASVRRGTWFAAGDVAGMNEDKPANRQVAVQMIDRRNLLVKESCQTSGRNYDHGLFVFGFDARDQPFDQSDIAPIES